MANRICSKDVSDNIIAASVMALSSMQNMSTKLLSYKDANNVTVGFTGCLIPIKMGDYWGLIDTATDVHKTTNIDTGSVAPSTKYYVYVVTNGTVVSFKTSTSASAPSGYTTANSCLLGNFTTDGSSNVGSTTVRDVKTEMTSNYFNSPTFVTPILGTPASGDLQNCTVAGTTLYNLVQQYYGVSWDESADTYVRTGATAGQTCGVTLANAFLPIQRRMRRCILNDDGTVNYYLSATDSTKKEDGSTAAVLDGTDGQVMVEIPKFWYRYTYLGTTHTWEISPVPLAGFEVHPAFMSDTTELDYAYVSAYEASLEDVSASLFVGQCYQTAVSTVFATSDDSITIATRTGWTNTLRVGQKLVISGTA